MNVSPLVLVLAVAALVKVVLGLTLALIWRRRRARQAFELAYHLDPGRQQVHNPTANPDEGEAVPRAGLS